jgi:hypothetical protein
LRLQMSSCDSQTGPLRHADVEFAIRGCRVAISRMSGCDADVEFLTSAMSQKLLRCRVCKSQMSGSPQMASFPRMIEGLISDSQMSGCDS